MTSSSLDSSSSSGDETFNSSGVKPACELFFLGFDTRDDGNCEKLFVDSSVEVENLENFGISFRFSEEGGVTFLPQKFTGTEERFYKVKNLVSCRADENKRTGKEPHGDS